MTKRAFPTPAADTVDDQRDIYTVGRLVGEARQLLEQSFLEVWVEGEITNLARAGSGHCYFSLKDAAAEVRCALFRNRAELIGAGLAEGNQVLVRARVTIYEPRGAFQLIVQYLEDAGEGALRRAFDALKKQLNKEGLFDPARKKPLPPFPTSVGLITSDSGAALHDLLTTFRRRCPAIRLIIYPTAVQGERAPDEIISALALAEQRQECEVLILARGGGSLEDLKAFNDERVARALHACALPTVCGVGHEIDVSICDLVADQRAATPTAAAELVSPQREELLQNLQALWQRAQRAMGHYLQTAIQRGDELGRRLIHPQQRVEHGRERLRNVEMQLYHLMSQQLHKLTLDMVQLRARVTARSPGARVQQHAARNLELVHRLRSSVDHRAGHQRQVLQGLAARLNTVSPLATLDRGYALVTNQKTGKVVTAPSAAPVGERVDVHLAAGGLVCKVEKHRS